ncbi:hypothetical protein ACNF42_05910 [Cuniculiplasma sp. SKW3]
MNMESGYMLRERQEKNVRFAADSVAFFSDWTAAHPQRNNLNAYLLINLDSVAFKGGDPMDYDSAQKVLKNAIARSGIDRRIIDRKIHWHLFQ